MKFLFIGAISFILMVSCTHTKTPQLKNEKKTNVQFLKKIYDFGNVPNDTMLIARYYFTNTGTNNLIVKSINPDCICTSSYFSNDTVPPKDTAFIELTFNTNEKYGNQKVFTTVCLNTSIEMYALILKANVIGK